MSETATRSGASRGRGSGRGGRGGFSSRGGRSSGKTNGDSLDALDTPSPAAFDEDADVAELRKLYGSKVYPIKDMFQGWSEVDILYALQEADGDENLAVERIAHGMCDFIYSPPSRIVASDLIHFATSDFPVVFCFLLMLREPTQPRFGA